MQKLQAVQVDRLRAAYDACGVSWHRLAQAAGVPHPTVSHLLSGRTKMVRATTLNRLAVALRVPAEWLTGERKDLPFVPEWPPGRGAGEDPSRWERPTADDVRWSWLMQAVEAAILRDLLEWYGRGGAEAVEAYNSWGRGLLGVFTRLGSAMVWRSVTLEPAPTGSGRDLWACNQAPAENWLQHILEPWLVGKAYLNANVLRGIFEALLAEPDVRLLGSETADAEALRALEQYATARKTGPRNGGGTVARSRRSSRKRSSM
jgi:transcriptional regulator with XRE-family HTH domain